ncbi:MAG: hypothetical protein LUC22_02980 [Prevotella sp.]|nr:hypothetical protein [Prevotella sp.]
MSISNFISNVCLNIVERLNADPDAFVKNHFESKGKYYPKVLAAAMTAERKTIKRYNRDNALGSYRQARRAVIADMKKQNTERIIEAANDIAEHRVRFEGDKLVVETRLPVYVRQETLDNNENVTLLSRDEI